MTAHTLRFDPTITLLREQLRTIEPLTSAFLTTHIDTNANLIAGTNGPVEVGALLELGIHLLDLIRFLTGEEILEVQCTMTPAPHTGPEIQVHAKLRTSGGIRCTLDVARVEIERQGKSRMEGEMGAITADWVGRTLTRTANGRHVANMDDRGTSHRLATLQAFVQAIRTDTAPPISGLDGCLAVEAADACYRSAARGGAVVKCEPDAGR